MLAVLLLISGLYLGVMEGVHRRLIRPSFAAIERQDMLDSVHRCVEAIGSDISYLLKLNFDWSAWDKTYEFMATADPQFIRENLMDDWFEQMNVDVLYFIGVDGRVVWRRSVGELSGEDAPALPIDRWEAGHPLMPSDPMAMVSGLLWTSQGPMLVASRPILTSNYEGPSRGRLVMGRFLNAERLKRLSEQTELRIVGLSREGPRQEPDERWLHLDRTITEKTGDPDHNIQGGKRQLLVLDSADPTAKLYAPLSDIAGTATSWLTLDYSRRVMAQGNASFRLVRWSTLTACLAIALFMGLLLRRLVIQPIDLLTGHVLSLSHQSIPALSPTRGRRDEIGLLSRAIDRMVQELDESQRGQTLAAEHARDVAESANHAKSAFLAHMSHELRTPLTAILGFTELLDQADVASEDRRSYAGIIHRNGTHLMHLINDVLDLSKIEAGKMSLRVADCDPVRVLEEVVESFRGRAGEKQLELRIVVEPGVPRLARTDPLRLRQILINITGNAMKFTARGSVVATLRCDRGTADRPRLVYEVRDTGPGIDAQTLGRLFHPFEQGDAPTRTQGTGLGLTISRRLAELLGGDISVESEVGRGSCFTLRAPQFPLGAETGKAGDASEEPRGTETSSGKDKTILEVKTEVSGRRVLLAEDSPDNHRLLTHWLKGMGLRVTGAWDGQEAIDAAGEQARRGTPYDLILMDMNMPRVDGYAATAALRGGGHKGPIVALTAHALEGDRQACLRAGCDDYATKPISRRQLQEVVRRHLAAHTQCKKIAGDQSEIRA